MNLQYLGTAASEGWPALFCQCSACKKARTLGGKDIRTRSQSIIDGRLLIDFPADTYHNALRYNLDFSAIEHILITHSHEDHLYPMDLILKAPVYAANGTAPCIHVYGNSAVIGLVKQAMKNSNIDNIDTYVKPILLTAYQPMDIAGYKVTPLLADHIPDEDCFIYLIEQENTALLYAHDTGYFPKATWEFLETKKLSAVSIDCTFVLGHCWRNHLGLSEVVEIRQELLTKKIASDRTLFIINHFSHNGHKTHTELEYEATKTDILVAYDSMIIKI